MDEDIFLSLLPNHVPSGISLSPLISSWHCWQSPAAATPLHYLLQPQATGSCFELAQTVQHSSHLAHSTVPIHFIKSTCWKVGLWAPFLELDIQTTAVMMSSSVANPLPGHLQTCWVIQQALRESRWGCLTFSLGDSKLVKVKMKIAFLLFFLFFC